MSTAAQSTGYDVTPSQLRYHHERQKRLHRLGIIDRLHLSVPEPRQERQEPVPATTAPPAPVLPPVAVAKREKSAVVLAWQAIVQQICKKHGFTREVLLGPDRHNEIIVARHELFYRLFRERNMGLAQIGRMLGGFDHTSVRNGVRQHIARSNGTLPPWKPRETWTPERRQQAEQMRAAGMTHEQIGDALGLTGPGISAAFRRWRLQEAAQQEQRTKAERMRQWAEETAAPPRSIAIPPRTERALYDAARMDGR